MAMQRTHWSLSALSVELGIDRRTLAKRIDRGAVPVADRRGKGGAPRYRLSDVLRALDKPIGRSRDVANALATLELSAEALMPWAHDGVVPLGEYLVSLGIEGPFEDHEDEIRTLLAYGMPVLPPAEGDSLRPADGDRLPRVSLPHAELWRAQFSYMIERAGGNGNATYLGREVLRLRGLP